MRGIKGMDQKAFEQQMAVFQVESDFVEVMEALSRRECRGNRRLRDKTIKILAFMEMIAQVRRGLAQAAAEDQHGEGDLS